MYRAALRLEEILSDEINLVMVVVINHYRNLCEHALLELYFSSNIPVTKESKQQESLAYSFLVVVSINFSAIHFNVDFYMRMHMQYDNDQKQKKQNKKAVNIGSVCVM